MVKPIKPEDIEKIKEAQIPNEVIEAFNDLITKNWDGTSSCVLQDDAINSIINKFGHTDIKHMRKKIFDHGWLNIENIFRNAGWKVEYDKPAYCESYPASFKFWR